MKLPHRVCPECGFYKGENVLDTDENLGDNDK